MRKKIKRIKSMRMKSMQMESIRTKSLQIESIRMERIRIENSIERKTLLKCLFNKTKLKVPPIKSKSSTIRYTT